MSKKAGIVAIIIVLMGSSMFAEKIDGPANCRLSPNGEIAFVLNNNVDVIVEGREGDWYKIIVNVFIRKSEFKTGAIELDSLYSSFSYRYIGKAINKIPSNTFEYNEESEGYSLIVSLYTYKNNIVESSLPEFLIPKKINRNESELAHFQSLSNIQFETNNLSQGYNCLVNYERYSPMDQRWARNVLIYRSNELLAYIYRKQLIENLNSTFDKRKLDDIFSIVYFDDDISIDKSSLEGYVVRNILYGI